MTASKCIQMLGPTTWLLLADSRSKHSDTLLQGLSGLLTCWLSVLAGCERRFS
jgi:hypothetical protein